MSGLSDRRRQTFEGEEGGEGGEGGEEGGGDLSAFFALRAIKNIFL